MRFLTAWRFLTVIPLPGRHEASPAEVGRSLVYFPVVGLIIGLILAGLGWLLNFMLPPAIVSLLLLIALVLITGALHLDGLADTCDGFGGHTVEERQQIMRDSHTGSFGVAGIVCLLLLKYVSLNSVTPQWLLPALVLMPTAGRWAMVYSVFAYPYARPSGLGKVFKQQASRLSLMVATLIVLLVAVALMQWAGLVIVLVVWGIVVSAATFFKRRFAGLTGDTYGAINEIAEVSVLLLVALLNYKHWLLT